MGNERLIQALRAFVAERDWGQFHTPANLAKSVSIESAELLECFQWSDNVTDENRAAICDELADVLTYCYLLADKLGEDPERLILTKLEKTQQKYPVDKSRGKSVKYDRLHD
jgi:NTP pyrophosphatase (non-canonical NTP hydrolase)